MVVLVKERHEQGQLKNRKKKHTFVTNTENSQEKSAPPPGSLGIFQWLSILGLIYGGCCSNACTLESIVTQLPNSGVLVTFIQFIFVSVEGLIHFLSFRNPRTNEVYFIPRIYYKPVVPISRWILPVLLFFAVSVLNNWVWAYDISVPVHIIFRSSGTVTTMLLGLMIGKKYTVRQMIAVAILTVGIIQATLGSSSSSSSEPASPFTSKFALGIALLSISSLLAAIQGVASEKIFTQYGKHWRESLFFTHFFSLFLFIPMYKDLWTQLSLVLASESVYIIPGYSPSKVPKQTIYLFLNAFTQYICVRGVNNLAAHASALTVTVALNVRKFISLAISALAFGSTLSNQALLGAVLVFFGAFLYSF